MTRQRITAEQWAAARAMWESDSKVSYSDVAESLGVSRQAVSKRAADDKWRPRTDMAKVIDQAHKAADRAGASEDLRKATFAATSPGQALGVDNEPSPGAPLAAPSGVDYSHLTSDERAEQMAIDKRAEVLGRHRVELNGARTLIYAAMREKDVGTGFTMAKRAKVVTEAMTIMQAAERKAWGLDAKEEEKTVVVLERG